MPAAARRPPPPGKPALAGLSLAEMRALLEGLGEPRYRAEQVFRRGLAEGITDPAAMTALLGKALRARLAEATSRPRPPRVVEVEDAADGTHEVAARASPTGAASRPC